MSRRSTLAERTRKKKEWGKKHAAGPSSWQHSHSFIPAPHRESASLHRDSSQMHETLLQRVQAQSHTTTHVSYQAVTVCVRVRSRWYPHILFIYMQACEHCLAGEIRGFFISVLLLRREWMRVLPVVYQTDHLLVGCGGSWEERRHVYLPIKEARDKAKLKKTL